MNRQSLFPLQYNRNDRSGEWGWGGGGGVGVGEMK